VELPREEALVRLYALTNQMSLYDAERFDQCPEVAEGNCLDCGRLRRRYRYVEVFVCQGCAMRRIGHARALHEARLANE